MQVSVIDGALGKIADALGPLSPFTKAIVPAALAVVVAVVNAIVSGSVDSTSITIGVSGLVTALVVYLVPNKPRVTAPPAPSGGAVSSLSVKSTGLPK